MPAKDDARRDRVEARLKAAGPALLLGLLLLLAFHGPLLGRRFYLRDLSQNHAPLRAYVTDSLHQGRLPLWDPYHGGGTPLLANPDALVLHPITLLFFVLPFDAAFSASIILQFALLAGGGYLLARALCLRREAAALVAAVLSLSGPMTSLASLQNILSATAWVPIGLWAFLRAMQRGRRWLLVPAAGCAAVVLLAAEPASVAAFVLLALVLGTAARGEPGRPAAPGTALLNLASVLGLAALLACAQILPARELLPLSERGAGFTEAEGLKWSLLPARLLEAVVPRLFGDPTRLSPAAWWGGFLFEGGYPLLLSFYVGAIPCVLAAVGAWHRGEDRARRRTLAAAGALALLLALGRNSVLYRMMFHAFSPMRQIRYPERFALITVFSVAILAGYGLERLLAPRSSPRAAVACACAAGAAFLLTAVAAASPLADRLLAWIARIPASFLASDGGGLLRAALLRSTLWAFTEAGVLAVTAALLVRRPGTGPARASGWLIVTASGVSMCLACAPVLSTAAPGWLTSPSPLAAIVGHGTEAPRLHHAPRPADLGVWGTTDELVWGYRYDRFVYALWTGHAERVPTALEGATDRMDLKESADLGRALEALPVAARVRVLQVCRVGFLLSYDPLAGPDLEPGPVLDGFSRPPLRVYRVRAAVPRLRVVRNARPLPAGRDLADMLSDPGYDPRSAVLIENLPAGDGVPEVGGLAGAAVQDEATILEETPERITIAVRAARPAYVVLADAYAPGWRVVQDGRPSPVLRADGLFRAVQVTAGRHTLDMFYRPASVVAGALASLAGLVIACAAGILLARSGR
ncbi:MAG: hypothetical protein AUH92_03460 [Acidobacteria bacterium 13_1_40CM_4_69_4]|nr:MAG: hypothetical protein AUH92_03460 [Acidobacteria bacterium 13_1_40CM_4_69_4]